MTDSLVRELSREESRRMDQLKVSALARLSFWRQFDSTLTSLVDKCEDLTHHYCPELWDQYKEGLITSSEFVNKLVDEMMQTDGRPMSPIDQLAAQELLARAERACHKFAKQFAKPIGDHLANEAVRIPGCSWRLTWTIEGSPYHYCHAIGSRLSDLDRDNR